MSPVASDLLDLTSARVRVAGHRGMVGSAVRRALERAGVGDLVRWAREGVDLRDRDATVATACDAHPGVVVPPAARVGGILDSAEHPVEFLHDNVRIETNVMEAAHEAGVGRLLSLGSSCIYPRLAPQPIPAEAVLTGPLEATNDADAIAKIAGILQVQGYRRQHGRRRISVMPAKLHGPGDGNDLRRSRVLPPLIRRFDTSRADVAGSDASGAGCPA